ncbi:hypothetical protein [Nakamurella lactea]|uniref:hypothetical protein n=1 Tax=Nakamurella lactea TaxID=459515 RepID=UPI0003FEEC7F|nr:hypothetical protein [Nakamurella lactea]
MSDTDQTRRDRIVGQALSAGKIHPTSVSRFRELMAADEKSTTILLDQLVAIPIEPISQFSAGGLTDEDVQAAAAAIGLGSLLPPATQFSQADMVAAAATVGLGPAPVMDFGFTDADTRAAAASIGLGR